MMGVIATWKKQDLWLIFPKVGWIQSEIIMKHPLVRVSIPLAEDSHYYTRPGKKYWPNWIL